MEPWCLVNLSNILDVYVKVFYGWINITIDGLSVNQIILYNVGGPHSIRRRLEQNKRPPTSSLADVEPLLNLGPHWSLQMHPGPGSGSLEGAP